MYNEFIKKYTLSEVDPILKIFIFKNCMSSW